MRLVRDLGRRKLRSTLTITGIMIGIMALVVFGSMANKIDALVKGGSDLLQGQGRRQRQGRLHGPWRSPLHEDGRPDLGARRRRRRRCPASNMLLSDDQSGVSMGTPPMIDGVGRGRRQGPRDVPDQLRHRPRPDSAGRGQRRRRPRLGPRPPVQRQGGRHRHPPRRSVQGRGDPRADAHRPGQLGDGPDGRRPAALHQDPADAGRGQARRQRDRHRASSSTRSPASTRRRSPTRSTPRSPASRP